MRNTGVKSFSFSVELKSSLCQTLDGIEVESLEGLEASGLLSCFYMEPKFIAEEDFELLDFEKVSEDESLLKKVLKQAKVRYTTLISNLLEFKRLDKEKIILLVGRFPFFEFNCGGIHFWDDEQRFSNEQLDKMLKLKIEERNWMEDK